MTDGGEDFNLGHVVGEDGEAGNGIASITKTGTSGLVDTYTITYDDGDTDTFTVTNGSDASVTIQTSWGSTTSDSKVPSEKLTKDSLDDKIGKSSTSGLVKNDGTIDTNSYLTTGTASSTYQPKLTSGTNIKTINNESLLGSGNITIQGGSSVDVVTSWEATLSDTKVPSEKLVKNTIDTKADSSDIPTKTSDLTNDGDGTNVFIKNNDSRLTDSRTPTSHTHGNLTNDGKVGSTANYFVYTTTNGAITSKQKIGNITTSGAIGSTANLPVITTTSGVLTTGSFGSTSGTFAEGNHTHSGYLSATKVTSWSSTPSDSNVASEKLVKDTFDDLEDLIGDAIAYINQ